jgi:glycosyltransferase involved in cell wall biosynthesis
VTIIASPVSYLTGAARSGRTPWVTRQEGAHLGEGITVLRAYTYPALHKSFVHRVFSFLSFMVSSFIIGVGVQEVDLVWGTSPPIFQGATAWALAKLKRVPFLFEVRDLWPAFAVAVGVLRQPLLIRASEWLEQFLYRGADQVMVNSPGFREHVTDRGAGKVALIPNGADMAMFDPAADGASFRREHDLADKFVALYAGAHGMSNDLGVLLQAADQLRAREDLAIVLLGAGKEKAALQDQARELGLTNVHFLPPVPKTAMSGALAAADACIAILKPIPQYATVYPNKVFDYMAAGRAVVLAIDGVIREVVEAAEGGLFVPPGDPAALAAALTTLADDPPRTRELGLNGRSYLETHFDRAVLAERLGKLIEKVSTE